MKKAAHGAAGTRVHGCTAKPRERMQNAKYKIQN